MVEYAKTKVDNVVSVSSIVTALRADLWGRICSKESHDFPEIFYMAQGRGNTVVNGVNHTLEAGQIIIYAPSSVHGDGTGGIAEIVSFEPAAPLPEQYCDRVITLTGEQRVAFREIVEQAVPLFEKRIGVRGFALKSHADLYMLQRVKNKLELFLLDLLKPAESYKADKMHTLTDYMMENVGKVLTLQQISSDLGISVPSLKRLTQENCGKSPIAYFNELKMEEAKRLIADSPLNITEIAQRLGFSSVHHFSKTFKQKAGVSPSEFKKK